MLRPVATTEEEDGDEEDTDADEEWNGIAESDPPPVDHEAEYVDEEKYTTVTVEAMDVSKEGLFNAQQERDAQEPDDDGQKFPKNENTTRETKKRPWTKEKPRDGVQKRRKKRNFRYENKADRKEARTKQKARNSRQSR